MTRTDGATPVQSRSITTDARGARRLVVLALAGALAAGACSAIERDGLRIRDPQPGAGGGISYDDTKGNVPYAFDDATVCLTALGSVEVTGVKVVRPTGGLRVTRFSIRPIRTDRQYNYITDPLQRLVDVGYPQQGPMVVDRACTDAWPPKPGEGSNLVGVEVTKPRDATATGGGFVLTYHSGNKRHQVYVPLAIVLCAGKIAAHPECQDHPALDPPRIGKSLVNNRFRGRGRVVE